MVSHCGGVVEMRKFMRLTISIKKKMMSELMQETGCKSTASAIITAIGEYLRQRKVEKIMAMQGKLKFDMTAEAIRHQSSRVGCAHHKHSMRR